MGNEESALEKALAAPKTVESDGQRVESHSLSEIVEAERYLASKKATSGGRCPLRFCRMASGGGAL